VWGCAVTTEALPVERLRSYLNDLTPEAQAMLVGELERALLHAEEFPGTDLVMRELRRAIREFDKPLGRISNPARLFFQPFEPFLVDEGADHRHRCRVARVSLLPFWNWIGRDLTPEETQFYSGRVGQALATGTPQQVETLVHDFQDHVAQRLAERLTVLKNDAKAANRLSVELGSKRAIDDVEVLATILRYRNELETLGGHMPKQVKVLADAQLNKIRQLLDSLVVGRAELLPFGLVLVKSRLAAPWQLIRLAVRAAESDEASRINTTPYGVAVTIVLDEVERMVRELRSELKSGQGIAVVGLLKSIHDAARGMRTEIDLSADSVWGRQLSAIRTEVSDLVKNEIDSVPGRMRRLLRLRPATEIAPGQVLDRQEVAEVETLAGLVDACRHFASELAINEITLRAVTEMQQYRDSIREGLLDGLRHAGPSDRPYRQSQIDAAVRFSARIFGRDYATVLAHAAEVAAGAERKAARAETVFGSRRDADRPLAIVDHDRRVQILDAGWGAVFAGDESLPVGGIETLCISPRRPHVDSTGAAAVLAHPVVFAQKPG